MLELVIALNAADSHRMTAIKHNNKNSQQSLKPTNITGKTKITPASYV